MLAEIKAYRISEKAKLQMEDELKKLPFTEFTNYSHFETKSKIQPLNDKIDHTNQMPIVDNLIDETEPLLEVPTFHLKSGNNILQIQKTQNEIIHLWHKNLKLWEIFKSSRSTLLIYVELLIQHLDKPHILFKTLKRLQNVNFEPTKRIINKIIQLVTSTKFQLLPAYLIKSHCRNPKYE